MKKKKIFKLLLRVFLSIVVLIAIGGAYVYSIMPKSIGSPIKLDQSLFRPGNEIKSTRFIGKPAIELARLIRSHQATSYDIVKEHLDYIRANNYKYNAFIFLRDTEALADAKRADEFISKGDTLNKPLLGIPISIKEMFWVKGSPSTMNAKMYGFIAPEDATVVKHLKKAGAIILGTTNVPYMLQDYQTQGEVYPTANNPYDTSRTPGGSTGGGAAAVSSGFSTLELGSDMGGSIRIPAAFCGLYGMKPSFGTVNITEGIGADTATRFTRMACASAGPLARNPQDLDLMWQVLKTTPIDKNFQKPCKYLPVDPKPLNGYKIAYMGEWKHGNHKAEIGDDVKNVLIRLRDSLSQHGVTLNNTAPDLYDEMEKNFFGSFCSMMAEGQPWLIRKFIGMDLKKWSVTDNVPNNNFQAGLDALKDASDAKWQHLVKERNSLISWWDEFFKEYDFFVCPVTYGPAIKKCPSFSEITLEDGTKMPYFHYFQYTIIFNATGHPCLTIPMGLNKPGLPIALQIVGPYYSEDRLIHFAKLIQPLVGGYIQPK